MAARVAATAALVAVTVGGVIAILNEEIGLSIGLAFLWVGGSLAMGAWKFDQWQWLVPFIPFALIFGQAFLAKGGIVPYPYPNPSAQTPILLVEVLVVQCAALGIGRVGRGVLLNVTRGRGPS